MIIKQEPTNVSFPFPSWRLDLAPPQAPSFAARRFARLDLLHGVADDALSPAGALHVAVGPRELFSAAASEFPGSPEAGKGADGNQAVHGIQQSAAPSNMSPGRSLAQIGSCERLVGCVVSLLNSMATRGVEGIPGLA